MSVKLSIFFSVFSLQDLRRQVSELLLRPQAQEDVAQRRGRQRV
jgi:hypothetical protein